MSTFVERLLGGKAGTVVTVEPDWIVINDGVSHAAVEEISAVAKPEKVMVIYDHDVPTGRPEAAAILRKNLAFAEKYGCPYIQAEGVGYQYHFRHAHIDNIVLFQIYFRRTSRTLNNDYIVHFRQFVIRFHNVRYKFLLIFKVVHRIHIALNFTVYNNL